MRLVFIFEVSNDSFFYIANKFITFEITYMTLSDFN